MSRYYPDRALRNGVSGRTTLRCTVNAKGQVTTCDVLSETPADYDFGKQAVAMAKSTFRLKPMSKDGVPVDGGSFTRVIVWQVPKDE